MRKLLQFTIATVVFTIALTGCFAGSKPLTVYLVRHAEDLDAGTDPKLVPAGVVRAEALARILADAGIGTIHSSDYFRTRDTAAPAAAAWGMAVQLYDPRDLPGLAEKLRSAGGAHLVVGHSNTTPAMVGLLGGDPGPEIDEANEYDRLYIVTIAEDGSSRTVMKRFGTTAEDGNTVDDLAWLAGCWASAGREPGSGEQWSAPAGGTMLGISRTVNNSRTVATEYMQIRETGDGHVEFVANPSGQDGATFALVQATEHEVVFENREHDFPQRIIYGLTAAGDLAARIEGEIDGQLKVVDFPMQATACSSSDEPLLEAEKLLAIHEKVLEAHRSGDLESWMAVEGQEYISANNGTISFPGAAERKAARAPYLGSTTLSVYRDLQPPVVRVSDDGSLGWLIAVVEVRGTQLSEDVETPVEAVWAWIELYEKQDGIWKMIGNVSNRRP